MTEPQELKLSPESPRRLLVGLSWDGKASQAARSIGGSAIKDLLAYPYTVMQSTYNLFYSFLSGGFKDDRAGRDTESDHHDLDLYCFAFDAAGTLQARIGTEPGEEVDATKRIYHSGDNTTGHGNEDEQIFAETALLPAEYHHLFFVVLSDSRHPLESIANVSVRLADAKTNSNALSVALAPEAGKGYYSYAFCHVFRHGEGWQYEPLNEYAGDIDWPTYFADWIKA